VKHILCIAVVCFMTAGCATWETVGGYYESRDAGYSLDLPKGWHRDLRTKERLVITRDGLLLQHIQIGQYPVDKVPLSTQRRLTTAMLPLELAEVIIDDLRSNTQLLNLNFVGNRPALVGGFPGFRITYSYQFKDNLSRMAVYDGVLVGKSYFFVAFQAPRRHYFDRDLPAFEQVSNSFKIKP